MLYVGEKIYDHRNYHELVGNGHVVFAGGEPRLLARTPPEHGRGYAGLNFENEMELIPRPKWPELLKEQIANKARVSDIQKWEPMDQDGLPICWSQGTAECAQTIRATMGLKPYKMSGGSLAVPISGGHSGGYEGDANRYAVEHGICTDAVWPNCDTNRSKNSDPAVQADRVKHKVLKWLDCGSNFDKYATACLLGFPSTVAYNWWGHVVTICDLVEISPDHYGLRLRNSWGPWGAANDAGFKGYQVLAEGHGTPGSGLCLYQMTSSPT